MEILAIAPIVSLFPYLFLSCIGDLVIPVIYFCICMRIAWKGQIKPPAKPVFIALVSIGLWWLAVAYPARPFKLEAMFYATLVPDLGVALALLMYSARPKLFGAVAVYSGVLFPCALSFLYLLPIEITDQEFPLLNERIHQEMLPGVYKMTSNSATQIRLEGYYDTSATITLYANNTFKATNIPDLWIGSNSPPGYDTFSGEWCVQDSDRSRNDSVLCSIHKLEPGSAWGPTNIWYESFKTAGSYDFSVYLTRQRGHPSAYGLVIISGVDEEQMIFTRQ